MTVIKTDRLLLRPVSVADAAFIFELQNTPKWLKYIGDRNIRSTADAAAYIQRKMIAHYQQHGYGNCTIISVEAGESVGTCGLFNRPGLEVVDIGFALLPQYEGKGYGTEAAKAVLAHAKNSLGLKKVSAIALPENGASLHVIEKLGMSFIKKVCLPGDDDQLNYYEIVLNK